MKERGATDKSLGCMGLLEFGNIFNILGAKVREMHRRGRKQKLPNSGITDREILQDTRKMEWMSAFRDWHVKVVFYLALAGYTDEQMAKVFEISPHVFVKWKKEFPTFKEAIDRGKDEADAYVIHSMYKSATGFEIDSEQIVTNRVKEYNPETGKLEREYSKIERVPIKKYFPPSVKAGIWWMGHRQPALWSNREDVTKKLTVNQNFDLRGLTLEELKVLSKIGNGNGYDKVEDATNLLDE